MDILENLNDNQKEAVLHINGPLLVLAGAGSGKTKVLTTRIAYLIQEGISPLNILPSTPQTTIVHSSVPFSISSNSHPSVEHILS